MPRNNQRPTLPRCAPCRMPAPSPPASPGTRHAPGSATRPCGAPLPLVPASPLPASLSGGAAAATLPPGGGTHPGGLASGASMTHRAPFCSRPLKVRLIFAPDPVPLRTTVTQPTTAHVALRMAAHVPLLHWSRDAWTATVTIGGAVGGLGRVGGTYATALPPPPPPSSPSSRCCPHPRVTGNAGIPHAHVSQ